jgi:hypothetical protein
MDPSTLKKKLSTYLSDKGYLRNVREDLLFEVLTAWEGWSGSAKDFYRSIGFSQRQMAGLIGKAKKLKRDGYFGNENFKELKIEMPETSPGLEGPCTHIELTWQQGKVIRFPAVTQLLEFLQKAS